MQPINFMNRLCQIRLFIFNIHHKTLRGCSTIAGSAPQRVAWLFIMNYHQQLKHANWLRKRFQILERDNYRCRICGSENEVEVHHLYYIPGAMIWDLDNEALVSVCHEHHELLNKELPKLAGLIALEILTGWDVVSDYKIFNTSTDE